MRGLQEPPLDHPFMGCFKEGWEEEPSLSPKAKGEVQSQIEKALGEAEPPLLRKLRSPQGLAQEAH